MHEDFITEGLKDFSISLNHIHEYQKANLKEQRIFKYVSEVYENILTFARMASVYYHQSGPCK